MNDWQDYIYPVICNGQTYLLEGSDIKQKDTNNLIHMYSNIDICFLVG